MPVFKDHFSADSAGYAAHRPPYPAALVDWLADIVGAHDLAWDAGCGSGQLAVPLARRFAHVVATDASAEQLREATPHERVDYRCAPAEASGLPGRSVDLAVAAQAAHWFDLERYYAEVRRVARAGAVIALVTYGLPRIVPGADAVLDDFHARTLRPHWPPERVHVDTGYRTLPFPFVELEPPALEIRMQWALEDVVRYVDTWSAVRALRQAGHGEALDEFQRALARVWGDPGTVREIRWSLAVRAGRVDDGP